MATKWPYLAFVIAFVLFLPYVIWNLLNGLPHVEFIRNAIAFKYNTLSPLDFLAGQLLNMHPVNLPVWLAGLFYFFFAGDGKKYRPLGIIFVTAFLILLINGHSKAEYLAPAYVMLFAAGGVQIGKSTRKKAGKWIVGASAAAIVVLGVIIAPVALPCLPVHTYITYAQKIGFAPESPEGKELSDLPQFYADMFGWEDKARIVSDVYASLPEEVRRSTLVLAQNYGQAGSLEYYSRKYDLPVILSGHNNYWLWGPGELDGKYDSAIILGGDRDGHLYCMKEVEKAAVIECQYCMPYENNLPVFVGRGFKQDLKDIWPTVKHYD